MLDVEDAPNLYREAAQRMCQVLNMAFVWQLQRRMTPLSFWQVAYALGLSCCDGVSMAERAKAIGVTRAALSKGVKEFQRATGLPPSFYMRSDAACVEYSKARIKQLA